MEMQGLPLTHTQYLKKMKFTGFNTSEKVGIGLGSGTPAKELVIKADFPTLRLHSTHSEDAWADLEAAATLEFYNDDPSTAAASVRGHVKLLNRADGWGNKWALGFGTSSSNVTATTKMLLDHTGYVGIGTTAPATKLHVAAGNVQLSDGYQFQWGDGNNAIFGSAATDYVAIKTNGNDRLTIKSDGTHNHQANRIVNSQTLNDSHRTA